MHSPVKADALREQIADRLRADVLSGRLGASERLSQGLLAKRFHVSRIPVRGALRILEAEGLVEYDPGNGAFVAGVSGRDLEELYEMRLALEPLNARIATANVTEDVLEAMSRRLEDMRTTDSGTPAWFAAHADFHRLLNERSGRKRVLGLLDNWRKQTERYVRLYQRLNHGGRKLMHEHTLIHQAAARRAPDLVEQAVREHLELVRDQVLESFRAEDEGPGAEP